MEDDIDIYEDLPSFEANSNEHFIKNKNNDIASEQIELKKQIAELTVKLENFQNVNENLECNLHSLLKTAKAEIARKDMVINDLRKKLDDITFKRRVYSKFDDAHNSTTRNTVKNNCHKPISPYFSPWKTKLETSVTDLQHDQIKEEQSGSTLTPITVYGERLRKRIIDEQIMEKKEKLNSNDNNNTSSDKEGTEKYIGESDKENGSFVFTNLCNTKNIQPSIAIQLIEQECTKNFVTTLKIAGKEFVAEDKSLIDRIPGTSVAAKQIILNEEKCSDFIEKSMKKENCVQDVSDRIQDISKYTTIESSCTISIKRNAPKSSDTGYTCNLSTKVKKYSSLISNDRNKKEEKKVSKKDSDTTSDNRIIRTCLSKRQNKSAPNVTFRPDGKKIRDHCLEIFKRDSHRSIGQHRRIRQKEGRYPAGIADRRSFRVRETMPYAKSPEGKYSRDQYPKRAGYGDRFEKHYDYRDRNSDKSKAVNKELRSTRDIKKRTNVDPSSTDRKTNGSKQGNHYEGYEGRRLRSADRKAKLEREKQTEHSELPKDNVEKSRECLHKSEILKRSGRKNNYSVIVQIERIDEKNNKELKHRKRSEKRARESEKPITNLEEGELANSPEKGDKRKKLEDERIEELSEVSSLIDEDVRNEAVAESKISIVDNIFECPLTKQDETESKSSPTSLEVNESAENVENIEKFIRELASNDSNPEKKHETMSEIACSNLNEKVPAIERDIDERSNTNEKEQPSGSENTCCNISKGEEFFENVDRVEAQARQSEDEQVPLNGVILNSADNHLFNKPTDVAEDQPKVEDVQLETVAKEDLLLVLGSKSPCIPSATPLESSDKTDSNDNKTTTKDDDGKNDIPSNHLPDDCNDDKEQKINRNEPTTDENKEKEDVNATTVTRTNKEQREKIGKCIIKVREEEKKKGSKELKKLPIRKRDVAKAKAKPKRASLNVQGKIVVFINRRKPVCLADNDANMTVIRKDKKHDVNVANSSDRVSSLKKGANK